MPYKKLKNKSKLPLERVYALQYLGNVPVSSRTDQTALHRVVAVDDDGHMSTLTVNPLEFTLNVRGEKISYDIRNIASTCHAGSRCCFTICNKDGQLMSHVFDCHLAMDYEQFSKATFKRALEGLQA
jgi:hypothetical protein